MARPQKARLRPLAETERTALDQITRAGSERADRVARAKAVLAVAAGRSFTAAAQAMGVGRATRWPNWSPASIRKG